MKGLEMMAMNSQKTLGIPFSPNDLIEKKMVEKGVETGEICALMSGSADPGAMIYMLRCIKAYCMLWNGESCSFYRGVQT